MRLYLPSATRNPISLVGAALATAMALLFVALLALEMTGQLQNPYLGLLLFVAVPGVLLLGLLLIPLGAWRQRRRVARGVAKDEWPVVDLRLARTRGIVLIVAALTCLNVLMFSLAGYGAVHHMESASFCGTTCHTTMTPQYAAYQVSPHARVACVSCHVGPGAEALVASKVAGTRQLFQFMTGAVPTPIAGPIKTMRPARETCEQCHWAEKSHGDALRQIREYADDERSTETTTTLQLHVGGGRADVGGGGIHWHMNIDNKVEYIATDRERQTIPWVKFTDRSGRVTEYTVAGTSPEQLAQGEHRVMDCMDCHNRPAHTFAPSAARAIDTAIAQGQIARDLPFARREAVAAVSVDYGSTSAALTGIAAKLREAYRAQPGIADADLTRLIAGAQDVYARNVFPEMKVGWGTYANNIGHVAFPGCFRCHDDQHKAADGKSIGQDCESCHAMP